MNNYEYCEWYKDVSLGIHKECDSSTYIADWCYRCPFNKAIPATTECNGTQYTISVDLGSEFDYVTMSSAEHKQLKDTIEAQQQEIEQHIKWNEAHTKARVEQADRIQHLQKKVEIYDLITKEHCKTIARQMVGIEKVREALEETIERTCPTIKCPTCVICKNCTTLSFLKAGDIEEVDPKEGDTT